MKEAVSLFGYLLIFLSQMMFVPFSFSATPIEQAQQEAGRIQQLEQQRRENRQREIEQQQRERGRSLLVPSFPAQEVLVADGPCFDITKVKLLGTTLLPEDKQRSILKPFINQCLGLVQINELIRQLTTWYVEAGYVASRAYIPKQDLSTGTAIIQVVEGYVESIRFENDAEQTRLELNSAFPHMLGIPLNLRDLEQGLEQLNRLQSNGATVRLLPGKEVGATVVVIDNVQGKRWQTRIGYSNSGQDSTGLQQGNLFWGQDNLFGLNDYAYLNYQTDFKDGKDEGKRSKNISAHWDLPWGYWNLALDYSTFGYLNRINGSAQTFDSTGETESANINLQYLFHRSQASKSRIAFGLKRKRSDNFIEEVKLETSSRVLSVGDVSVTHEHFFSGGRSLNAELTFSRGLNLFGALDDNEQTPDAPRAQFRRYTLDLNWRQPFYLAQQPLVYSSRLFGQTSPDLLFSSEQLSIGSEYTVRGFKSNSISGNKGAYWRNEVGLPLKTNSNWLSSFNPYLGWDIGKLRRPNGNTGRSYDTLSGWVIGVHTSGKHWRADVAYSRALSNPSNVVDNDDEIYFSLSLNY